METGMHIQARQSQTEPDRTRQGQTEPERKGAGAKIKGKTYTEQTDRVRKGAHNKIIISDQQTPREVGNIPVCT